MPKISFCFSGWMRGVDVESVSDVSTGLDLTIDAIKKLTSKELADGLNSGKYAISLANCLSECGVEDDSIEMFDYEAN